MRDRDVADLHFDGGIGYQFISVLVSFFVVSNINTTYSRFWEARGHLGKALLAAGMLADRAAIYSSHSQTEKAQIWRDTLKTRLIELVTTSMHFIQNERASLINLVQSTDQRMALRAKASADADAGATAAAGSLYERHELRESLMLETAKKDVSKRSLMREAIAAIEEQESTGARLASVVDAVIVSNGQYLDTPLVIHEQMDLLSRTSAFLDAIHGLLKFSTTP